MSSPYVGEIRMFAGNFAPAGWALCQGQTLAIADNDTLFNLIGTTYGGDGQTTFNLPDLQGRAPLHMGQGPGRSNYVLGEKDGVEMVTVTPQLLPAHTHAMVVSTDAAEQITGEGAVPAAPPQLAMYYSAPPTSPLNTSTMTATGGSQPHDNMVPFLCVNFIISLFGIFPSQN